MSGCEQNYLESIIKVETEEFQEFAVDSTLTSKAGISGPTDFVGRLNIGATITDDDVLRFKANM